MIQRKKKKKMKSWDIIKGIREKHIRDPYSSLLRVQLELYLCEKCVCFLF